MLLAGHRAGSAPWGAVPTKRGGGGQDKAHLAPLSSGCPISLDSGDREEHRTLPGLQGPISFLCIPCSSSMLVAPARLLCRLQSCLALDFCLAPPPNLPAHPREGWRWGCPKPLLPGQPWTQRPEPNPGDGGRRGGGIGGEMGFPKSSLPCSRHPPLLPCWLVVLAVCILKLRLKQCHRDRSFSITPFWGSKQL